MAASLDIRSILQKAFRESGIEWQVRGIVDTDRRLYTLDTDTKLISKIFEMVAFPIIFKALDPYNVRVETEERQTVYPDLTVVVEDKLPNKIAIDIKSTYRKRYDSAGFTLGSYTAYMRPPHTKNIRYPYHEYAYHWIVGFIYNRTPSPTTGVLTISDLDLIIPPVTDVEIIIQEKWRVASDRPGSGNTTNIGSVRKIAALRDGTGTFARFGSNGEDIFEDYWRNYDRTAPRKYTRIEEYQRWRTNNPE